MAQRHFRGRKYPLGDPPWRDWNTVMSTHADFLRLKAEECRAIADLFHEGDARFQLLIIAQQYERLADRYDRIEKSLMRAPILLV
jgi:hypothetical protein